MGDKIEKSAIREHTTVAAVDIIKMKKYREIQQGRSEPDRVFLLRTE